MRLRRISETDGGPGCRFLSVAAPLLGRGGLLICLIHSTSHPGRCEAGGEQYAERGAAKQERSTWEGNERKGVDTLSDPGWLISILLPPKGPMYRPICTRLPPLVLLMALSLSPSTVVEAQSNNVPDAGSPTANSMEVKVKIAQAAVEYLWGRAGSLKKTVAIRPILQRRSYGRERVEQAKTLAKELANRFDKPLGPVIDSDVSPLRVSIPQVCGDSTAEITITHHGPSTVKGEVHILRLRLQQRGEKWKVKRLLNEAQFQISDPALPWSKISFPVEQNPKLIGGREALQDSVEYPSLARKARIESRVIVQFFVDWDGEVRIPKVVHGGHELLNDAAIEAVRKQKFKPGTLRGEPVRVPMSVPVLFELPDSLSPR